MFHIPRILISPRLSTVAIGAAVATAYTGHSLMKSRMPLSMSSPIYNDSPLRFSKKSLSDYAEPINGHGKTRLNGKIDYHQLTFGSFSGMVTGYIFGRISKFLVGVVVTSLMATEYLSSAGYIDLKPFYNQVYKLCYNNLHQEVLVDDPSFKYSFGLAFLISAYNA